MFNFFCSTSSAHIYVVKIIVWSIDFFALGYYNYVENAEMH